MTPKEFIDFLDGFLSFNPDLKELNATQTRLLKEKLSTVFNKVTPKNDGLATGAELEFEEIMTGLQKVDEITTNLQKELQKEKNKISEFERQSSLSSDNRKIC